MTVVIPTRNRVGLLQTTLRSVLAQHDVDLHVMLVDDGSDPAIAQDIRELGGGVVTVHRNATSRGVAAARNQGLAAATTTWVAFLDDDDLWTPTKLADQVAAATADGRDWSYTGAVKFVPGPVLWQLMPAPAPQDLARVLADRNVVPAGASNVLVRRDLATAVGGFDEGLGHLADWDLWLQLLQAGLPAATDTVGVCYRLHHGAMSRHPAGILSELETIDVRWRALRGGRALDPGPTHLWIATSHLRSGQRVRAGQAFARAVPTQPAKGLRGLLRVLHPSPPTAPHVVGASRTGPVLKRRVVVELPADVDATLQRYAGTGRRPEGVGTR